MSKIFFFTVLPFGLSSAPALFTKFMTYPISAIRINNLDISFFEISKNRFIKEYFIEESGVIHKEKTTLIPLIKVYIDDIFGFHPSKEGAWKQFDKTEIHLKKLGLETKKSKAKPPNHENIILGSVFDLRKQELRAPLIKVARYITSINKHIKQNTITQKDMLSDIGRIRHIGGIHKSLNAFARGLEKYAYKVKNIFHHINMTQELIKDYKLCIWALKRTAKFGIPFDFLLKPANSGDIICYTDAASIEGGIGGFIWRNKSPWFSVKWSEIKLHNPTSRDIMWRELAAIYVMIETQKIYWKHKAVTIFCDNEPVVWMLIKMRAPLHRPDLQILIRQICIASIEHCFNFWIDHVPGDENKIADALSRDYINPFSHQEFPFEIGLELKNAKFFLQNASDLSKPF